MIEETRSIFYTLNTMCHSHNKRTKNCSTICISDKHAWITVWFLYIIVFVYCFEWQHCWISLSKPLSPLYHKYYRHTYFWLVIKLPIKFAFHSILIKHHVGQFLLEREKNIGNRWKICYLCEDRFYISLTLYYWSSAKYFHKILFSWSSC